MDSNARTPFLMGTTTTETFFRRRGDGYYVSKRLRRQRGMTRLGLPGTGTAYGNKRWPTSAAAAAATFVLDFRALFNQARKIMKTKSILVLLPVICAALSVVQAAASYTTPEAAKHVGETATVTGKVDGVNQSARGNIFLNIGGKEPNQAFTAVIPATSAGMFSRPQNFQGRTVAVSGKIALSKGKPQIVVNSPSQITAK